MPQGIGRIRAGIVGLVLIGGAVGAAYAVGLLGVPVVVGVDNRFAGVNQTTTLIVTDIVISNPNPIGANVSEVTVGYQVWLNEVALAEGTKQGVAVPAGNSTLSFSTALANDRLPAWWVSHIRNGEHTRLRVEANVTPGLLGQSLDVTPVERSIDTDILSAFNSTETRPVDANVPLVADPVLYVNETGAAWGDVSTSTTPIDMRFAVYNPKPVPYVITKVSYTITMNDVTVGTGETAREYVIEPQTERTVEATTAIRNERLDEWWVSHLENNQVTTLRIEFTATIELPGGQTIEVPLESLTYTEVIETDFFGNKAGGGSAAASGTVTATTTATGDSGDGMTVSSRGHVTDDNQPPATSAPTPTPTSTPDDGLPLGNETDVL